MMEILLEVQSDCREIVSDKQYSDSRSQEEGSRVGCRRGWSEDQSRIKVGHPSLPDNSQQEIFLGLTICEESLKHICTYSIRS